MKQEYSVGGLAQLLDGQVDGDADRLLVAVTPLDGAGESDLSFVESERTVADAMASRAGCLLAPPGLALPGRTVIRVRNPRYAMARAIELFYPQRAVTTGIHPTAQLGSDVALGEAVSIGEYAVVGDGCSIRARSRIGAGSVIGAGCVIGENCVLHPRVTLYDGSRLGARVILHSGVVIGSDGFGYVRDRGKYHKFPQVGTVEIGDDVEIGANSTIDRAALGVTRIGRGTKIDNLVQVGHNVVIGENCVIAALVGISGSVVIGDNVVIAGQVGIGDHARIESGVILGGQCGILPHKVVKAGEPLWGTPARPLREHLKQQATLSRLTKRAGNRKND